jgi:hypothetical protein
LNINNRLLLRTKLQKDHYVSTEMNKLKLDNIRLNRIYLINRIKSLYKGYRIRVYLYKMVFSILRIQRLFREWSNNMKLLRYIFIFVYVYTYTYIFIYVCMYAYIDIFT